MAAHLISKKKTLILCSVLFFLGLVALTLSGVWWPGIMLAVGVPFALRQYLLGRFYDMGISLLVFVGTFITVEYDIAWRVFLPILFTVGAIYIIIREVTEEMTEDESEKEEDLNHEIEERKK